MSESKQAPTPGPWTVHHIPGATEEAGIAYFELRAKEQKDTFAENEANARLMAASPDLFAALSLVAKGIRSGHIKDQTIMLPTPAKAKEAKMEALSTIIDRALSKSRGEG